MKLNGGQVTERRRQDRNSVGRHTLIVSELAERCKIAIRPPSNAYNRMPIANFELPEANNGISLRVLAPVTQLPLEKTFQHEHDASTLADPAKNVSTRRRRGARSNVFGGNEAYRNSERGRQCWAEAA